METENHNLRICVTSKCLHGCDALPHALCMVSAIWCSKSVDTAEKWNVPMLWKSVLWQTSPVEEYLWSPDLHFHTHTNKHTNLTHTHKHTNLTHTYTHTVFYPFTWSSYTTHTSILPFTWSFHTHTQAYKFNTRTHTHKYSTLYPTHSLRLVTLNGRSISFIFASVDIKGTFWNFCLRWIRNFLCLYVKGSVLFPPNLLFAPLTWISAAATGLEACITWWRAAVSIWRPA